MLLNPHRFGSNHRAYEVVFSGSAYLTRGANYTGLSDSTQGIFSCWVKFTGGNGSTQYLAITDGGLGYNIQRSDSNKFRVSLTDGSTEFSFETSSSVTTASGWVHLLASWDTNYSSGNKLSHIYLSDTSSKTVVSDGAAFTPDYNQSNHGVGANPSGAYPLRAEIADLYFAPGQFLDFSNSTNRRKFISSAGKPVSLGSTGSTPTGVQPLVFLSGQATTFATNLGSGGGMTTTGSLVDAGTSPSD